MSTIDLDEMKSLELDILREVDRFCAEHDLQYYLTAGTLLGAVRHHGFIPWDDDIDVTMPRNDYETLFELFNDEHADSPYRLISYRDHSSIYPFFKIIDTRTVVEEIYVDPQYSTGVWVDIFPLEGLPAGDDSGYAASKRAERVYKLAVANPEEASTRVRKFIKKALVPLARHRDIFRVAERLDHIAAATPITPGCDVGYVIWGYGPCERMPYSFLEPTELEFEGEAFQAPALWDEYLTSIFGDYMTPPPLDERVPHNCVAYWKDEAANAG